jgi:hypothetical protein
VLVLIAVFVIEQVVVMSVCIAVDGARDHDGRSTSSGV